MAFIHRFGSSLNAHLHFHCVVIDGVFDAAATGGIIFTAATGVEANAIADVQARVRQRLLRYCARPPFALDRLRELLAPNSPLRTAVTALGSTAITPPPAPTPQPAAEPAYRRAARYAWALLLARIYEVFPLRCTHCGADLRIIAFITDGPTVRDILAHLGEPTAPPRIAPARGPPLWEAVDAEHVPAADPLLQPAPAFEFDQRIVW